MTQSIPIIEQVLLFQDPSLSIGLGPALWAAFKEIESFFNYDQKRAEFRRFYLSEKIPPNLDQERSIYFPGLQQLFESIFGSQQKNEEDFRIHTQRSEPEWEDVKGKYSNTYDAIKIRASVANLLKEYKFHRSSIIVTDLEITPPKDLRYIIWDKRIVSIAPTDPRYWKMDDPDRISIIKHRVRTACLSNIGVSLGLHRCGNERCFLYRSVDSVLYLDGMIEMGKEHGLTSLDGFGFSVRTPHPNKVQALIMNPEPDLEGWIGA